MSERKINPDKDTGIALYNEGCMLVQQNKFKEAIDKFTESIKILPDHENSWLNLAIVNYKLGKLDQAKSEFLRVLAINPSNIKALNRLASIATYQDESGIAIDYYSKITEIDPNYAPAYSNIGVLKLNSRDFGDAEYYMKKAIQIDPSYLNAYYNLASLFVHRGEMEKAIMKLNTLKQKAIEKKYPLEAIKEKLEEDRDFEVAFENLEFQEFMASLSKL